MAGSACKSPGCVTPQKKLTMAKRKSRLVSSPRFTIPVAPLRLNGAIHMPVKDWGDAVVWVPDGATQPRPIVLGVHGNDETPDVYCQAWRDIVGTRAFLICPQGTVREGFPKDEPPHYGFASGTTLAMEVNAAIDALLVRFPDYADGEAIVYIGFSRGAFLSVPLISTEPARFPRAIVVEGGQDAWTPDRIAFFGAEGGQRVVFACGQVDCFFESNRVAAQLNDVGVPSQVVYEEGAGHVYTGPIAIKLRSAFDWVVSGDPRWEQTP
jgi:dienelactone hydrolase